MKVLLSLSLLCLLVVVLTKGQSRYLSQTSRMKVLLSLSLLCLLVVVLTKGAHQTYRLHYRGAALCATFTRRKASVNSVIRVRGPPQGHPASCTPASLRLHHGLSAFSYCEGETVDCILAASNYTVGSRATSGPSCLLYSSLPPPPPRPQGTKQFKLSSGTTSDGSVTSLSAQNLCAADGLQFAMIETANEHKQLLAQVGPEIRSRCTVSCLAWIWLDSNLHWVDGSVLNKCEVSADSPSASGSCAAQEWETMVVWQMPCTLRPVPVICQTYV
ncbi:uncharacterized protein LOC125178576 [Hyalella azteca]|uniref:Uncharacterized protein LOC125178576 n=1 Tax=Hyalella azteca TaxID=294128 RepID=A0A979FQ88_HYAAZ|nr:uncharacterized protein LOC125178576 [Hyalella azteca]